jgi:hypothetical protein
MKVLITEGTSYYLVDLDEAKQLSLREVLVASAEDELVIVDLAAQDHVSLDTLLGEALNARVKPVKAPVATAKPKGTSTGSGRTTDELTLIREWATGQGLEVKGKGRVTNAVLQAYDAAH